MGVAVLGFAVGVHGGESSPRLTTERDAASDLRTTSPVLDARAAGTPRFPAEIPLRRDAEGASAAGGAFWGVFVVGVLAIAGTVLLVRRRQTEGTARESIPWSGWRAWLHLRQTSSPGRLRLIQSERLTAQASVHVLLWDEQEWLVGTTAHGVTLLARRGEPDTAPAAGTGTGAALLTGAAEEGRA